MTPRTRLLLTVTSLANLLQNLFFPVLAVRALGAGTATDALFMVFILPGVVMVLLGNSVLNWLTPRLVRRVDDASRRILCWSLLWVLLGGVSLLCLLLWLGGALATGDRPPTDSYAFAFDVLPLAIIAVLFTVVSSLAQCLYVAESDVPGGEWRTLAGSTLVLVAWFAVMPATLESCALFFVLRAAAIALMLAPRLGRPRGIARDDADLRGILRESRVLLIAATYYKSEPFVDRLLFGSAPGGAVAAYHLAVQVLGVVTQLVQRVVVAPLIAPFAEAVHQADIPRMRRIIYGTFRRVLALGIVVWALVIFAGEALLQLLFAGSAVEPAQLELTAQMLAILGGYMMAILLGMVSAQVYYCGGETRRVVVYSSGIYTLGLVLKLIGLWYFGVIGLVAAASLGWILNVALFWAKIPAIFRSIEARGPQPASL